MNNDIVQVKNGPSEKVKNRPSTSRGENNEEDYDDYEVNIYLRGEISLVLIISSPPYYSYFMATYLCFIAKNEYSKHILFCY